MFGQWGVNVISERAERMWRSGKGGKSAGCTVTEVMNGFKWGLFCRKSTRAKAWSRLLSLTPADSIRQRLRGRSWLQVREKLCSNLGSL